MRLTHDITTPKRQTFVTPSPPPHRSGAHECAGPSRPRSTATGGPSALDHVVLRIALEQDVDALTDFYERLDARSRYHRFFQAVPRVRRRLAETMLSPRNHVVVAVDAEGRIVGEAVLGRSSDPCQAPELAYAVSPEWRRRGVATALVARLIEQCVRDGVTKVTAVIGFDNRASIELMRSFGATFGTQDGAALAELQLPRSAVRHGSAIDRPWRASTLSGSSPRPRPIINASSVVPSCPSRVARSVR